MAGGITCAEMPGLSCGVVLELPADQHIDMSEVELIVLWLAKRQAQQVLNTLRLMSNSVVLEFVTVSKQAYYWMVRREADLESLNPRLRNLVTGEGGRKGLRIKGVAAVTVRMGPH